VIRWEMSEYLGVIPALLAAFKGNLRNLSPDPRDRISDS